MKKLFLMIAIAILSFSFTPGKKIDLSYFGYYDNAYVVNLTNNTNNNLTILLEWDGGSEIVDIAQYQLAYALPAIYNPGSKIKATIVSGANGVEVIHVP